MNVPARLLIVEDDASLREGLTAALVTHGFDVRAEADGRLLAENAIAVAVAASVLAAGRPRCGT